MHPRVGGSGNFIAQNDQDLGAEESNSSFDRRHRLSGNFVIEPPFGPNRAFFNKGDVWSKITGRLLNISGNFTFASGGWATPTYSDHRGRRSPQARPSSLRPNRDFAQPIAGPGTHDAVVQHRGLHHARSPGTYGNASRNSIELPGTVSRQRRRFREPSRWARRAAWRCGSHANNVFNTVQYSGVVHQRQLATRIGQVTGAAAMRSFTYKVRYRF